MHRKLLTLRRWLRCSPYAPKAVHGKACATSCIQGYTGDMFCF